MPADVSLDMNGKQRSKGAFVYPTILYSTMSVNHESLDANNIVSKHCFVRTFPTHEYSQTIPHIFSKNMSQVSTRKLLDSIFHSPNTLLLLFSVTLLTLKVIKLSLWLFLSCMRVFIASTMSVMEEYSQGSRE